MKQDTLDKLRQNLVKDLKTNKRIQRNINVYGYTYEVEYIPILVERRPDGNCGEIDFPDTSIIYENENNI